MKELRRPLVPMNDALRERGKIMGIVGMILLFGSAIAVVLTPSELLVFLLPPMLIGIIVLMVAYISMRKAERAVFEHEHASHSSRLRP